MHFAYKEEGNEHRQDSTTMTIEPVYGLRLRPRPYTSNTAMQFSHASSLQHNPNLHTSSWNQPLSGVVNHHHVQDYGGRRVMPVVSTRWNPTAEQLQALEEMYRRGTTTPTAQQIQQIAAKLRRFGKIEGKNVFYWFQNHKARDRQKKRRQLELLAKSHSDHQPTKSSGLHKRSSLETDQPKKLSTMSTFSTSSKYSDQPVHGAVDKKSRDDERERGQENAYPSFNFSTKNEHLESGIKGDQTLELFPIKSRNDLISSLKLEDRNDDSNIGTKLVPNQFFEFLPTKN